MIQESSRPADAQGILWVPDFNSQIPRRAFPHRFYFENSVSVVDHANLLRCRSGSDLRTGVANRGTKRTERNKKKERRSLAEKISVYGRRVHQRYPTGDVVVREGTHP